LLPVAISLASTPRPARLWDSIFAEGYGLMRERLAIYVALAAVCALAAWLALPHIDLYDVLASHPTALVTTSPVSVVLGLALAALFFIFPSALRKLEPNFKMTTQRILMMLGTMCAVGAITEVGYAFAIVPGIVATVVLSQALIGTLLRTRESAGPRELGAAVVASFRGSFAMTKTHFATTLGVIVASLFILLVPFVFALLVLAIAGVRVPPSLVLTAPLLFLTFIYFECVRYALIVRWYRRLSLGRVEEPFAVSP
jgi:hypothetical protein